MANMNVTPAQIQMAAAAGVQLLQVDDLKVPLIISKGGALSILEGFLRGGSLPVMVGELRSLDTTWQFLRAFGPGCRSDVFE